MATARLTFTVGEGDTARALGSGDLEILATPRLLAWCEAATCQAARPRLGDDDARTSVGTRVQLDHLLATPIRVTLDVSAEIVHSDGRLLEFDVTVIDHAGPDGAERLVATGRVRRVIVDRDRFLARLPPAPGGGDPR